ncbi:MAG TPA: NAD(P)/FAD-dependent oxidoreductase [Polyangiales bacterium]|nr:NAD(P)/FAD-dependent oxidoreductase [Polyangiales bacterium]
MLGEVQSIDRVGRMVRLEDGEVPYDYLLVATGATHSYFGHDEWEPYAPGLKTLEDAAEMRRRIVFAFEAAERERDPVRQREWLTFVVIGGGPTGVELAGALAEIARQTHAREFHHIDPHRAHVVLLEGLPELLSAYPASLSAAARRSLEKKGVEVRVATRGTDVQRDHVVAGGERIPTRTALWAAGVAASPIVRSIGAPLDRVGRVQVTAELNVPGHSEIFVAGDLAAVEVHGRPVPGVAPTAMAMGKYAARSILRRAAGQPVPPFDYFDRGTFALIGRGAAVGNVFERIRLRGYLAWTAWLAIHITYLIGFRSRLAVLFNWGYAYLTKRRYAQLIVGPPGAETSKSQAAIGTGR